MSDNESSLSSPLSSALSIDALSDAPASPSVMGTSRSLSRSSTPARRKRSPSPPHEYVLADNEDIAFIVMFRARFSDAFPQKLIHFGPQDIERGIVDSVPSPQVESLLCALLALVLNRKKPIERGHYGRALEEAISTQKSQWPRAWHGVSPLAGGTTFNSMTPQQRLSLMRALIMWSLNTSEVVTGIIKESYKQARHEDDLNQRLSVHSWGRDGDKRRYWLVEGKDDTDFRVYRESNPALKTVTWRSVAGSIDELQNLAKKLEADGSQAARRLSQAITAAIPRFEATEEKRKRREYRLLRKAQFTRPEPGFSNYEGRTRGKRMKYTYSDEEDSYLSDSTAPRRSTRASNFLTEPTVTASGRQTRTRYGALYGSAEGSTGRSTPAFNGDERVSDGREGGAVEYDSEAFHGDSSAVEEEVSSGEEWGGVDEQDAEPEYDSDAEMDDAITDEDDIAPKSLLVTLKVGSKNDQALPERVNPTPSHTPLRTSPQKEINGAHNGNERQSTVNGINGSHGPVTPDSEEKPKPAASFDKFLYKPTEAPKLETAANTTANGVNGSSKSVDGVAKNHFHAPDVSVQALTGHSLAFPAPSS